MLLQLTKEGIITENNFGLNIINSMIALFTIWYNHGVRMITVLELQRETSEKWMVSTKHVIYVCAFVVVISGLTFLLLSKNFSINKGSYKVT